MARKHKHEEHVNHEAWAIPYGDLVTLLLAFFVVMYAISSVNEGKFRVLSDSLLAAFRGTPKTLDPVQVGEKSRGAAAPTSPRRSPPTEGKPRQMLEVTCDRRPKGPGRRAPGMRGLPRQIEVIVPPELAKVADEVEASLPLSSTPQLVTVRRHSFWIEVEIRADILFPSGVATISQSAIAALQALAKALSPYPNPCASKATPTTCPSRP